MYLSPRATASIASQQTGTVIFGVTQNERVNDSLPDHWYVFALADSFHKNQTVDLVTRCAKFSTPSRPDDIGDGDEVA